MTKLQIPSINRATRGADIPKHERCRSMCRRGAIVGLIAIASLLPAAGGNKSLAVQLANQDSNPDSDLQQPNVVLIVADGLGVGGLSCYGNEVFKTPNLDRLAASGMKFNNAYCSAPASAPSLGMLLTGQEAGSCSIRVDTGGVPLPGKDVTIAEMLKQHGYQTGGFGKWALGIQDSEGDPMKQGFDEFFGYYHQTHAQNHFAEYLIRNGEYEQLPENLLANISTEDSGFVAEVNRVTGKPLTWTPELIMGEAKDFIRRNKERPFFCYLPLTLPHGHFHIPDSDPALTKFKGRGWSDWAIAAATMTQRLDSEVGALQQLLSDLELEKNTVIIFCSANGATMRFDGELDSAKLWRGSGKSVYEGALRIPMIVSWPGQIPEQTESNLAVGLSDVFSTLEDLTEQVGVKGKNDQQAEPQEEFTDPRRHSFSFARELMGDTTAQKRHEFFLWQWAAYNPGTGHWHPAMQAVRSVNWKLLRHSAEKPWELYDLATDPTEATDLADQRPELVARMEKLFQVNVSPASPQREAMIGWNAPFKWVGRDEGRLLYESKIENVVEESASQFKGVTFDNDAILLGMSKKQDSTGTIHLNFAWQLKSGRRPDRFVHLCDTEGTIIKQLSGDKTIFSDVDQDKTVVDYIAVTPEQLESADSVAVGFYDTIRKSAVVANGTTAQKYKLTVWEKQTD